MIEQRAAQGKGFAPVDRLRAQKPGAKPRSTKSSQRYSKRPLVLTLCAKAKAKFLESYFAVLDQFLEASEMFRGGMLHVQFPQGTYRPYNFCT